MLTHEQKIQGSEQLDESFDPRCLPIFAQVLQLTEEETVEMMTNNTIFLDPRAQMLYQGIKNFAEKHQISLYLCAVQVMDLLYSEKTISLEDIANHLSKKIQITSDNPLNRENHLAKAYKTILIVGRSGEGKSTTVNHLVGKTAVPIGKGAKSETVGANLYVSDRCRFNIIDTEGLDGTHTDETNQDLMNRIRAKTLFYLEFDASIDAILIMWCPLKNGRSCLAKTIKALQASFGDDIIESCIVVVQGNWKLHAEILDLTEAVPEGIEEIQMSFPNVPIVEYDAKGLFHEQLPLLNKAIDKVKPHQLEFFEERRKNSFFRMAQAFQIKVKQCENANPEQQREKEDLCSEFQGEMCELLNNREKIAAKKDEMAEEIWKGFTKFAEKIGEVSGKVFIFGFIGKSTTIATVGLAGLATAGVVASAGAIAVGLYGFYKGASWLYDKITQ